MVKIEFEIFLLATLYDVVGGPFGSGRNECVNVIHDVLPMGFFLVGNE